MTKEFILAEIRRVTGDGKPPGIQTFAKGTGIREYDWQRYWTRWREALAEAGYEANKLSDAYTEEYLLEKLVGLAREGGHIPTIRELRIRRDTDPTIPRSATLFTRFGGRSGLISRVRQYASELGYEDVVALCDAAATPAAKGEERSETPSSLKTWIRGYVYLTKFDRNRYKIGRTNDPLRRRREVKTDIPYPTDAVHEIATDDPVGIEAYWHKRFADKRIDGTQEFYRLDAADVGAFKRRKFM